jgi:hypothetical protein
VNGIPGESARILFALRGELTLRATLVESFEPRRHTGELAGRDAISVVDGGCLVGSCRFHEARKSIERRGLLLGIVFLRLVGGQTRDSVG